MRPKQTFNTFRTWGIKKLLVVLIIACTGILFSSCKKNNTEQTPQLSSEAALDKILSPQSFDNSLVNVYNQTSKVMRMSVSICRKKLGMTDDSNYEVNELRIERDKMLQASSGLTVPPSRKECFDTFSEFETQVLVLANLASEQVMSDEAYRRSVESTIDKMYNSRAAFLVRYKNRVMNK